MKLYEIFQSKTKEPQIKSSKLPSDFFEKAKKHMQEHAELYERLKS